MRATDDQRAIAAAPDGTEPPPAIGSDERRMHVRAYNFWVSLLGGRAFPAIADLDPAAIDDFGPNSVLLDFRDRDADPGIAWLGSALREEGRIGAEVRSIAEVPGRSLLSRLTDHYLQIIANRAPIGFEAEFVNVRGFNAMYRGILMPFSSDGTTIDFIYGVINWKELADPGLAAEIVAAAGRALASAPAAPAWADGPSRSYAAAQPATGGFPTDPIELDALADDDAALLADRLAAARVGAEAVLAADQRGRAALYRAIALAYAFALAAEDAPEAYAELLADCGIAAQARAPMTPVVKLVFGSGYDKTRLAEYAAALAYARRREIAANDMAAFLEAHPGGLKAVVAAERTARRPARTVVRDPRAPLRAAPAAAVIALDAADEFVLLVARRDAPGRFAVLGAVMDEPALLDRALRRFSAG